MYRLCAKTTLAALLAVGCSGPADDDVDVRPGTTESGRYGLIMLTHHFGEPGIEVSGQLLAYDAPSRIDALHALAVPVQAWLTEVGEGLEPGAEAAAEGCRRVSAAFDRQGHVDLLSAGALHVGAPAPLDLSLNIVPRDFPALRFSLSGVVYDADAPEALPYLAGGDYTLSAPGAEVGAFAAQIRAAGPIWITGASQDAEGLHLSWGGDGPARLVIARDAPHRTVGLVCRSPSNAVTIDVDTLRFLGAGEAQVVIARLTHAELNIDGLDAADAVFMSRDTLHIDLVDRALADETEDSR